MSDKHKDIEELFKDAASNAGGAPPPPADWGAMSSLLQESALIQTGAGAGAAKVGILKALGTKAIMLKVVAGTMIVGGGLTGSYILLKDEPAQIAANTTDQNIHQENSSIDQSNTIGYNDHIGQNPSANAVPNPLPNGKRRGTSSSSLSVEEELKSSRLMNDGKSSQIQEKGGAQTLSNGRHTSTTQDEQTPSEALTSSDAVRSTNSASTVAGQTDLSQTSESMEVTGSSTRSKTAGETVHENLMATNLASDAQDKTSSQNTSLSVEGAENKTLDPGDKINAQRQDLIASETPRSEDLAGNVNNTDEATAMLAVTGRTTNQTNPNTSNSSENTVDADQGTPISANTDTNPSVSTGTTGLGGSDLASQNALSTTTTLIDENEAAESNSGTGNVETHLTWTSQNDSEPTTLTDDSDSNPDAINTNDQESAIDSDIALNTSEQTLANETTADSTPLLNETSEVPNSSTPNEDLESIGQTINDALPPSADTSNINDLALEDSIAQLANTENALLAQADSLIEQSDSATLQPGNITMRPDEPKWLISPYFSIDRSNYAIDQFALNNLAGSTKDLQIGSNGTTFSAGVRGAYNIAPYLWLESGFLYSKKSGIQGIMELYDDNNEVTALANYQLTGDFYEIPLALGVRSNNGYFGWYFKAGVNLAYNRASASSYFEYYDFNVEKVYTIKPSFQTLNPAITASAGFEYNILPQLRFYAEPNFRFATRPVLNTSEFDQIPLNPKWSTMGLGIGINYYLGKK